MASRQRVTFSVEEKTQLWRLWRAGQSYQEIGRLLDRPANTVLRFVGRHGGIPPVPRTRADRVLSLGEREEISRGIAAGHSLRTLAAALNRSPSTVSREIARNGGLAGYRATHADARAWACARRPKPCRLRQSPELRRIVAGKLRLNWSPEQISGWLKHAFPTNDAMRISHETIYRSLFIQARGVLKKELLQHLRSRPSLRHPKASASTPSRCGHITEAVSLRQRPAEVSDRAIPGHWEGDLLAGALNSYIVTLVERASRYTLLIKVASKDTHSVVTALTRHARRLPIQLRRSLTWDRGMELAQHKRFTIATTMQVYFCDPYSPWQRGTNENTNRLLRQYFPKGTDVSVHSQADLNRIALALNQRPRKTLGFRTPADRLQELLH
ncbi:MAG: IS30 family transposase [Gammaproteobacteria bacterium]|nr:IS30 family transposase [Gammaproteobacteria bacterium]